MARGAACEICGSSCCLLVVDTDDGDEIVLCAACRGEDWAQDQPPKPEENKEKQ